MPRKSARKPAKKLAKKKPIPVKIVSETGPNVHKEPKQVRIEKVKNGFTVSKGFGDETFIEKTSAGAQKRAMNLLK